MTTVAVIGGGAAGIGAARRLLLEGSDVVLFEVAEQPGGNCQSVAVTGDAGQRFMIDAGVSDFNRTTFVEFARMIDELQLPTRAIGTDTSFAALTGQTVASCRNGHWRFADGHAADELPAAAERFRLRVTEALDDPHFATFTLGRYLDHIGASPALRNLYVLPRAIAAFPMPNCRGEDLPLRGLIEFFRIHGVVGAAPANRHCIVGGMHRYPAVFGAWFTAHGGELRCGVRITGIRRHRHFVELRTLDRDGRRRRVDVAHVVLCNHATQALPLLSDATEHEVAALRRFPCQTARVVVHRDARVVGDDRTAFGAFNYVLPAGELPRVRPTITFFPNRLAGLPEHAPDVFVSMNPHRAPRPELVITERSFVHPIAGPAQDQALAGLVAVHGRRRTWLAGSYLSSPFVHESALTSGMRAAEQVLECERPTRCAIA